MQRFVDKKKVILLVAVLSLYVLIITPLLVINLQKKQELRGRAQSTPAQICSNVSTDTILILDATGSMSEVESSTGRTKLASAKIAAKSFVDKMSTDSNNRIGLVTFSDTAHLNSVLTNNFISLKTKIDSLTATGSSCHDCAVRVAKEEFGAHGRSGIKKVAIFLTDGIAINVEGNPNYVPVSVGQSAVLTRVKEAYNSYHVVFYPVGFGDNVETNFLKGIASMTGGEYHFSPTGNDLQTIFNDISQILGKGSITGFVFNDVNNNKIYDSGELKLSGWNLNLIFGTNTRTYITDSTGYYNIGGLCDGAYQLKEVLKPGWTQTLPVDPNGYAITITNGNQYTDKNFGNTNAPTATPTPKPTATPTPKPTSTPTPRPTATPTPRPTSTPTPTLTPTPRPTATPTPRPTATPTVIPSFTPTPTPRPTSTPTPSPTATLTPTMTPTPIPYSTDISLTVYQHGIWNSGDNTNPIDTDLSNKNPVHKTIKAAIELFDLNNQLVVQGSGGLIYSSAAGNFQGVINLSPNSFTTGKYYLKVKTDYHLRRRVPGVLTITAGQKNIVPPIAVVTGDANNDNQLNILDYNLLLGCYSDLQQAAACDANKKVATDFNDDLLVNQVDYNLFIREIATQPGE